MDPLPIYFPEGFQKLISGGGACASNKYDHMEVMRSENANIYYSK